MSWRYLELLTIDLCCKEHSLFAIKLILVTYLSNRDQEAKLSKPHIPIPNNSTYIHTMYFGLDIKFF